MAYHVRSNDDSSRTWFDDTTKPIGPFSMWLAAKISTVTLINATSVLIIVIPHGRRRWLSVVDRIETYCIVIILQTIIIIVVVVIMIRVLDVAISSFSDDALGIIHIRAQCHAIAFRPGETGSVLIPLHNNITRGAYRLRWRRRTALCICMRALSFMGFTMGWIHHRLRRLQYTVMGARKCKNYWWTGRGGPSI